LAGPKGGFAVQSHRAHGARFACSIKHHGRSSKLHRELQRFNEQARGRL